MCTQSQVAWFEGWGTIMLNDNFIIKLVTSIYGRIQHRETCSEKQKQKETLNSTLVKYDVSKSFI